MEQLSRIVRLKIYGWHLYEDLHTAPLRDEEREKIKSKLKKIRKIIDQYGYNSIAEGLTEKLMSDKEFVDYFLSFFPGTAQYYKRQNGESLMDFITKDQND
jgi:hypothetical protein